jgi:hypothetical protein
MQYKWKKGARQTGDAQVVGDTLTEIEDKHGRVEAHVVVAESRPDDAPLHPHFEWDDSLAGEQWREAQARRLIKSVVLVPPATKKKPEVTKVSAFIHDPKIGGTGGGYTSTAKVLTDSDLLYRVLEDSQNRLKGAEESLLSLLAYVRTEGGKDAVERAAKYLKKSADQLSKVIE